MIVRVFRVWVADERAEDWQRMVEEHSIPWMKAQSGCVAFYPGKPMNAGGVEFSMISVWTDIDAIRSSVGENWDQAILFGDEASIAEQVEVDHYEVFGDTCPRERVME